ncbi:hypothetical protein ERY430_60070 [Erythrobacter sp. EC-HK427]|nr:hypothetical protein ERY430_60070 [Erythrobacter sp. EC-HK427]
MTRCGTNNGALSYIAFAVPAQRPWHYATPLFQTQTRCTARGVQAVSFLLQDCVTGVTG